MMKGELEREVVIYVCFFLGVSDRVSRCVPNPCQ